MNREEIVRKNIHQSKLLVKSDILKDRIIIFFTRILEDLMKSVDSNFYGRLKELYNIIYPYSKEYNPKKIFKIIKQSNLISKDGLMLDKEERGLVKFFIESLDEKCKVKNKTATKKEIDRILTKLVKKYLPHSSQVIEPFLLAKIVSSIGSVKKMITLPSSTIQLIGAEKALFRHMSKNKPCPKYGIMYHSKHIKKSKKPGKKARQIANQLALNIRVDYFNYLFDDEMLYDGG